MSGISRRIKLVVLIVVILASAMAGLMYYSANQLEVAYVWTKNMGEWTYVQNNTEEFLVPVEVPKNRDFEVVTDPAAIVGMYTSQSVVKGQLVQASMLAPSLPDGQRRFEQGILPVGTRAYPIDIPPQIAGTFNINDLIDIYVLLDRDGVPSADDTMIMLFQKVTFLGPARSGDSGSSYLVSLTPEQIAAYEGWLRLEGIEFTGAITQPANGNYQPLHEFLVHPDYNNPDIREMFAPPTPTPPAVEANEVEPNEEDESVLPVGDADNDLSVEPEDG